MKPLKLCYLITGNTYVPAEIMYATDCFCVFILIQSDISHYFHLESVNRILSCLQV